jgi:hypothetical protein
VVFCINTRLPLVIQFLLLQPPIICCGSAEEWPHATAMVVLCFAFFAGAAAGAWLTPRLGGTTLLPVAVLIAAAVAAGPWALDRIWHKADIELLPGSVCFFGKERICRLQSGCQSLPNANARRAAPTSGSA